MYNVILRRVRVTIVAVEKQEVLLVSLCVCVRVVLFILHATRMRHIVTSFVAPVVPLIFFTFCRKRHDFRKKSVTEYKMCVLILSTNFIRNFSHSRNNAARYCHECENVVM